MMPHFDGAHYNHIRDHLRLSHQHNRIFNLMLDGVWRSLQDIEKETGDTSASISAALRNMRKPRFGGHTVNKQNVGSGRWLYQLVTAEDEQHERRSTLSHG
jgi:hypothetical protein